MMDFIEGDLMFDHLSDSTPMMLACIHSELHSLDPEPLIMELDNEGVSRRHFSGSILLLNTYLGKAGNG